jgi:hypothetical protein
MKKLWQILVPCVRNSGKPFRTRHHKEWDRQVRLVTGGLTVFPPVKGQWEDPKTNILYSERMIPVNIIASEKEMSKIVKLTAKHYDQIAVMYFLVSNEVLIYNHK